MPKYWGKIISHTGVSPKWVNSKRRKRKKKERRKVGNNNGQLRIANAASSGAHKAAWAKTKQYTAQLVLRK